MTTEEVILNVDDVEAQRYVKRRDLEANGFSVVDATTGAEALRLTEKIKPAVVLLDVQLPDINGYEVCHYVKSKWPEVMVLMTSSTFVTSERARSVWTPALTLTSSSQRNRSNSQPQSTQCCAFAGRKTLCEA